MEKNTTLEKTENVNKKRIDQEPDTITDKNNCGNCMSLMPNNKLSRQSNTNNAYYWMCTNKQCKYYGKGRMSTDCLDKCNHFDSKYEEPNKIEKWRSEVQKRNNRSISRSIV